MVNSLQNKILTKRLSRITMYDKEKLMSISIRLNEKEAMLIKTYAEVNGITISELFRNTVLEKIEDELDISSFEASYENYKKDNLRFSHEDVIKIGI